MLVLDRVLFNFFLLLLVCSWPLLFVEAVLTFLFEVDVVDVDVDDDDDVMLKLSVSSLSDLLFAVVLNEASPFAAALDDDDDFLVDEFFALAFVVDDETDDRVDVVETALQEDADDSSSSSLVIIAGVLGVFLAFFPPLPLTAATAMSVSMLVR